jgi:nitrate/nitrite transporter NarK
MATHAANAANVEGSARQWRNLILLAIAELLGLTLWFSSSAVTPAIKADWGLTTGETSWLVMAVQIGFVVGTFASGVLNLPDLISARKLFAASAALGALSNVGFALLADGLAEGIAFRLLTGLFLAGV